MSRRRSRSCVDSGDVLIVRVKYDYIVLLNVQLALEKRGRAFPARNSPRALVGAVTSLILHVHCSDALAPKVTLLLLASPPVFPNFRTQTRAWHSCVSLPSFPPSGKC